MVELLVFSGVMAWMTLQGMKAKTGDTLEVEIEAELEEHAMSLFKASIWLIGGLLFLVISSRLLVWGAVSVARDLGVSDLIIGLTIVAIGTSLPELAASIVAARKGEHDLVVGNIIGSNLFNTLAVVGLAGVIQPMPIPDEIISRDWLLMAGLTASLFVLGYNRNGNGCISRLGGIGLLSIYAAYTLYLINTVVSA
jgi:cation:H+ antiporter